MSDQFPFEAVLAMKKAISDKEEANSLAIPNAIGTGISSGITNWQKGKDEERKIRLEGNRDYRSKYSVIDKDGNPAPIEVSENYFSDREMWEKTRNPEILKKMARDYVGFKAVPISTGNTIINTGSKESINNQNNLSREQIAKSINDTKLKIADIMANSKEFNTMAVQDRVLYKSAADFIANDPTSYLLSQDEMKQKIDNLFIHSKQIVRNQQPQVPAVPQTPPVPQVQQDEMVAVINPNGKLVNIKASDLQTALSNGYKYR